MNGKGVSQSAGLLGRMHLESQRRRSRGIIGVAAFPNRRALLHPQPKSVGRFRNRKTPLLRTTVALVSRRKESSEKLLDTFEVYLCFVRNASQPAEQRHIIRMVPRRLGK